MPRKASNRTPQRPAADGARHPLILDEAQTEEVVRLARSPDPLPSDVLIGRLGGVEVQKLDGSRVRLRSLWVDRAAAVVWLRHYG